MFTTQLKFCVFWSALISLAVLVHAADTTPPADSKKSENAKAPSKETFAVRVRAGSEQSYKDSGGHKWLGDVESKDGGFEGGLTIERPELKIENTKDPDIYRAEHYSMDSFSWKVPNGKYIVKLHFCETFDGIGGPGERVFSFKVQDKEFKDFDVWKHAGGPQRAYIETVSANVSDGKLKIVFTPKIENPQINGIEIIAAENPPAEKSGQGAKRTAP